MKFAAAECPDMVLGVGSVVDAPTAALYLQYGANFVVGPCFVDEVARLCNRHTVPYIPGCGTVTEIVAAQGGGMLSGEDLPGGMRRRTFVREECPRASSARTDHGDGAVEPTEENLLAWFEAGVACVGMGSQLFPAARIAAGEWAWITEKCRFALGVIRASASSGNDRCAACGKNFKT